METNTAAVKLNYTSNECGIEFLCSPQYSEIDSYYELYLQRDLELTTTKARTSNTQRDQDGEDEIRSPGTDEQTRKELKVFRRIHFTRPALYCDEYGCSGTFTGSHRLSALCMHFLLMHLASP